jgi:hypothetical protein
MTDDSEQVAHLLKVIAFERKQYEDQIKRLGAYTEHLEKLAHKNHAIRLVEILEAVNWEGGQSKLTKAQAKGADHVVKLLRGLASVELGDNAHFTVN